VARLGVEQDGDIRSPTPKQSDSRRGPSSELDNFLKFFVPNNTEYVAFRAFSFASLIIAIHPLYMEKVPEPVEKMAMPARRAMTLIECMVALVIVVASASMMAMVVQGGLSAQEDALSLTLAGTAAESRITEYLATPYETISAGTTNEAVGQIKTPTDESFSRAYANMGRQTVVTASALTVPDFPGLSIAGYLIDVTVFDQWQGQTRKLVALQRFRPRTIEETELAP